jgi:hypothetical protein
MPPQYAHRTAEQIQLLFGVALADIIGMDSAPVLAFSTHTGASAGMVIATTARALIGGLICFTSAKRRCCAPPIPGARIWAQDRSAFCATFYGY